KSRCQISVSAKYYHTQVNLLLCLNRHSRWICIIVPEAVQQFRVGVAVVCHVAVAHNVWRSRFNSHFAELHRRIDKIRSLGMHSYRLGSSEIIRVAQNCDRSEEHTSELQ